MPDIVQYGFMVRALVAGALIAITLPVLGSFLVARRYALIADSLAHVSLAGVGIGLVAGLAPAAVAIPFTVIGALSLEWLRQRRQVSGEVSLAILMSAGLAIAVVLAGMARGASADFDSYLFGSITATGLREVMVLSVLAGLALATVAWQYRALLHIAFDEDSARIAGYRVTLLNYVLVAFTAAVVATGLRIVGGLLMSALLVIPIVTASRLARSFSQTIGLAVVAALLAVVGGLVVAFYAGVPAGGAIVLSALVLLILSFIWKP